LKSSQCRSPFRRLSVATVGLAFLLTELLALETFFAACFLTRRDVRGGTIMRGSHAPLRKRFWAICTAACDKRGVPASQPQK